MTKEVKVKKSFYLAEALAAKLRRYCASHSSKRVTESSVVERAIEALLNKIHKEDK